ncbi:MAG: AgmX/PglI C-terminal domain-containing protein [Polyangiaceae bacterium]
MLLLAGCADDLATGDAEAPERVATAAPTTVSGVRTEDDLPMADGAPPARGLGTMARVPGSDAVVGGVRLVSHRVRTVIQDGFARTEIEEEFRNETAQVLEGRYRFALPPRVSISRLALWVGSDLVEGAIVERERAARIFRGIVEDTVRPRDPALLQWERGSELAMTIFPVPAGGSRRVVLAYDEVLVADGGWLRYVLPLSLGPERATAIDDFSIEVEVVHDRDGERAETRTPGWATRALSEGARTKLAVDATDFIPDRDFVVEVPEADPGEVRAVVHAEAGEAFFSARVTLPASLSRAGVAPAGVRERVVVVDASDSESPETLAAQARLAMAAIRSVAPGGRFAVLACDSACDAYPGSGALPATSDGWLALRTWLDALVPRGASDLTGALLDGLDQLDTNDGQLIVFHDGQPSAGELSHAAIAARLQPQLEARRPDFRLIGMGRSLDEALLGALARTLGASYDAAISAGSLDSRIEALRRSFDQPVLRHARIELPSGYVDVRPSMLPSLRLGEQVTLVGKLRGPDRSRGVRVTGELEGAPVEIDIPLVLAPDGPPNPLLPRVWAEREMAEIDAAGGDEARNRVVALSQQAHVLSRHTSLLVLENERMFREHGIVRTIRQAGELSDHGFGRTAEATGPVALGSGSPLPDGAGASQAGQHTHTARPPQIRMGSVSVSGRLPAEAIQRTVRLQAGRFRACYARGLRKNPELAGRVATRFLIDRSGAVSHSEDAGSDLPDAEVVACVVRHFRALAFPVPPDAGVVTVVYPFVFRSDGSRPRAPVALWPEAPEIRPLPSLEEREAARDDSTMGCVRGVRRPRPSLHVVHAAGDPRWGMGHAKSSNRSSTRRPWRRAAARAENGGCGR